MGLATTVDGATWRGWCDAVGLDDVYYRWEHLAIWARAWKLAPLGIRWVDDQGTVLLALLRDDLDALPGGAGRCDLRTAYDMGGPLLFGPPATFDRFEHAWDDLLRELGCVTLFQRLHPFRSALPRGATLHAQNRVAPLEGGIDAVRARMYGSWRRDRNRAEREGCTTTVEHDPALFAALYRVTMERVGAAAFYRFDEATLTDLVRLQDVTQLVTRGPEGRPAATALSLRSGDVRFYHLSASDPDQRHLRPSHHLVDGLLQHAIDDGCRAVHLGGGAPSLYRFKSRVGPETVPYRVEKRVVDPDAYAALCAATGRNEGPFPAYLGWTPGDAP